MKLTGSAWTIVSSNAVTVQDSYPLPRMDEYIDSLRDAKVFTTLDAMWGYRQIDIANEDRDKTTFVCNEGLYRCLVMPFGLRNAPATFQRAIDIILLKVKWRHALFYLDDIIVLKRSGTTARRREEPRAALVRETSE